MNTGICPVCNGSKRKWLGPNPPQWTNIAGYDKDTNTLPCTNCGGQYMSFDAKGTVPLRPDGKPCTHSYKAVTVSNCYHRYTCEHCGDVHHIDSGD